MSNLDRRIARLEQALGGTDIRNVVARMTREERRQRMIEILAPCIGEESARAHVHRMRTDRAYADETLRMLREAGERAGIIPRR
jgi:hypothetical protein